MLSNRDFWQLGARELSARQFHPKAVSAFYDHDRLRTVLSDPWAKRDDVLPLPGAAEGYSVVQIVGSFGVGKTTLVRQLIGTSSRKERFPSTAKGRTTICDTEIICASGDYSAVVSFLSRDRARALIEECVEAAVSSATEGLGDSVITRRFVEHSEQRFRLAYILGKPVAPKKTDEDGDSDDETEGGGEDQPEAVDVLSDAEKSENAKRILGWIERCKALAQSVTAAVEQDTGESAETLTHADKDAFLELVDERLQQSEELQEIVDDVMEAVEERFGLIQTGLDADNSGWPVRWQISTDDRQGFLHNVSRFTGNYQERYGRLLTPLVDGIRVKGPFKPSGWAENDSVPSLVLLDGEGLGHVTSTSSSVPTSVTRRFGIAHAILLVDNAEAAMTAGPQALLRCVVSSGHERKLVVAFTHFDQMRADTFANDEDRKNFVLSSLEQAIVSLDQSLDSQTRASRRVRKHLEEGRVFFLGRLNEVLDESSKKTRGTRKALNEVTRLLAAAHLPEEATEAVPCYDLAYLFPGIHKATEQFQQNWNARLGLAYQEGIRPEHWKRIEALARRFAKQWDDKYDNLQPVAHLRTLLVERLAVFWATPKAWKPAHCTQEAKEAAIQKVTREFSARMEIYVSRRFREDHLNAWSRAYGRSGRGSGRERSNDVRMIDEDVALIPAEERASKLFDDIRGLCREAITAAGGEVLVA